MRCLHCHQDGLEPDVTLCPRCHVYLPTLLRALLPPGSLLRAGDYEIDHALGQGGFGITYRARHVGLNRPVAIKEFYPQEYARRDGAGKVRVPDEFRTLFQNAREYFLLEGQLLAHLDHGNVVKVHDCFRERETAYLVMELIDGRTLEQELEGLPGRRLPPGRVGVITDQLVDALAAVHEAGVYHLDVKPANVLLEEDRAILVDFGAARQEADLSRGRAFTREYAPLELMAGEEVGPESDLFELGMMLHEMLTGERPPDALRRVRAEWAPVGLPERWAAVLEPALRLVRADRPRSVRAWWRGSTLAAGPATHHVSQRGRTGYRTIGEAVARAAPGDRVLVRPGLYEENLVLDRPVQILGNGKREEIILQSSDANCLLMRADSALVRGLTIRGRAALKSKQYVAVDVERGQLELENCIVTSDSLACVAVRGEGARPVIRDCKIHRGAEAGLLFLGGSRGTVEDCEIAEHALAGVAVRDGAAPTLRRCQISKVSGVGVLAYRKGSPILEGCTIEESGLAGVEIRSGANPSLRGCDIRSGEENGVLIHQGGAGSLERCTISANRFSGIESRTDGTPAVKSCRIRDNAWYGVLVHTDGGGTFEDNELGGNGHGAWFLDDGGDVRRGANREG